MDGKGNPSSFHVTSGVGLPVALHFKETAGPGCNVCSMKLYSNTGGASIKQEEQQQNEAYNEKEIFFFDVKIY